MADLDHSDQSSTSSKPSGTKWVRFDDSVSMQTTISDPSSSERSYDRIAVPEQQPVPVASMNGNGSTSAAPFYSKPVRKIRPTRYSASASSASADVGPAQIQVDLQETTATSLRPVSYHASMVNANNNAQILNPQSVSTGVAQELENGKTLCTILPESSNCQWISPPYFNPYKMPKSLVSDKLAMPVEDYVTAMEMLTNDFRFRTYNVCYRRLIVSWLIFGTLVLVAILASGLRGLTLFGIVLMWLFVIGLGIIGCLFIKRRIDKGVRYAVMCANKIVIKHNLLVGVEDRGKISCNKICIPFVYFKVSDCLPIIKRQLNNEDQARAVAGKLPREISVDNSIHEGRRYDSETPYTTEERAEHLILRYSQSYVKAVLRQTIKFPSRPIEGVADFTPLHSRHCYCLCQYLQKFHFEHRPVSWFRRFF